MKRPRTAFALLKETPVSSAMDVCRYVALRDSRAERVARYEDLDHVHDVARFIEERARRYRETPEACTACGRVHPPAHVCSASLILPPTTCERAPANGPYTGTCPVRRIDAAPTPPQDRTSLLKRGMLFVRTRDALVYRVTSICPPFVNLMADRRTQTRATFRSIWNPERWKVVA